MMYKELILMEYQSSSGEINRVISWLIDNYPNKVRNKSRDELEDMAISMLYRAEEMQDVPGDQNRQKNRETQAARKRQSQEDFNDRIEKMRNPEKKYRRGHNEETHWHLRKGIINKVRGAAKKYVPGAKAIDDLANTMYTSFRAGQELGRSIPSLKNQKR